MHGAPDKPVPSLARVCRTLDFDTDDVITAEDAGWLLELFLLGPE